MPLDPDRPVRVVIDTDAANEIDDQFALAWALTAPDRLSIEAITAAPFCHGHYLTQLNLAREARATGAATPFEELAALFTYAELDAMVAKQSPRDGMEASLAEIERVVEIASRARPSIARGGAGFIGDDGEAVDSDAARLIIELAHASDEPLHVAVLGAPTNVASALLIDPTIAPKLVVVFVAGYPTASRHIDDSFNLVQDRAATNRVFAADVDLVYIPGYHVAETLSVSLPELEAHVAGHGPLADALVQLWHDNPLAADPSVPAFTWVMWDLAPIAWLIDPSCVQTTVVSGARVDHGHRWQPADGTLVEAFRIDRRAVYGDLFRRLAAHGAPADQSSRLGE